MPRVDEGPPSGVVHALCYDKPAGERHWERLGPVPPRLARNNIIEPTFEVGRRFRPWGQPT